MEVGREAEEQANYPASRLCGRTRTHTYGEHKLSDTDNIELYAAAAGPTPLPFASLSSLLLLPLHAEAPRKFHKYTPAADLTQLWHEYN